MTASGGFGGRLPADSELLVTSAWDVSVTATWLTPHPNATSAELALTLGIDAAAELSGTLSKDGSVTTFPLLRQSGSSASTTP